MMAKFDETAANVAKPGAPVAQIMAMMAGGKAAELATAVALAGQSTKQRRWLEMRGRLDNEAKRTLDARVENDRARAAEIAGQVLALAAIPPAKAGSMQVGGRVTKAGVPQERLTVGLVERGGKSIACTQTDGNGIYGLTNTAGLEALVQVSNASGKQRLWLEERPISYADGGVAMVDIDLAERKDCPPGPDTSDRLTMPDLVGLSADDALKLLKERKIEVASRKFVEHPLLAGKIVETDPPAGHLLPLPPQAGLAIGKPPRRKPAKDQPAPDAPRAPAAPTAPPRGPAAPTAARAAAAKPSRRSGAI